MRSMVARRSSEEFEKYKQEAEKSIQDIERLFPEVELVVAGSDFGRDATEKARALIAAGEAAPLKDVLETLARTHKMFKGVVGKA